MQTHGAPTRRGATLISHAQDFVARERVVENGQKSKFRVFSNFRVKFDDAEIFIKSIDTPCKHVTPRRIAGQRSFCGAPAWTQNFHSEKVVFHFSLCRNVRSVL